MTLGSGLAVVSIWSCVTIIGFINPGLGLVLGVCAVIATGMVSTA